MVIHGYSHSPFHSNYCEQGERSVRLTKASDDIQAGRLCPPAKLLSNALVYNGADAVKLLQHLLLSDNKPLPNVIAKPQTSVDDSINQMDHQRKTKLVCVGGGVRGDVGMWGVWGGVGGGREVYLLELLNNHLPPLTLTRRRPLPTRSIRKTRMIRRTAGEKLDVDSGKLSSTMMSTRETSRMKKSKMFHLL